MWTRETGLARDRIEFDLGTGTFRHQSNGFAHAKIDNGRCACLLRCLGLLPALVIANVDQSPQFAIKVVQRWGSADQIRGASDVLVERRHAFETGTAET